MFTMVRAGFHRYEESDLFFMTGNPREIYAAHKTGIPIFVLNVVTNSDIAEDLLHGMYPDY